MMLNLYRRFLFITTGSAEISILLVLLSAIEEVILRSTSETREMYFRKLTGMKPLNEADIIQKRKFYSYSITANR